MNLHAASAYAIHLLKARSTAGHGVHSPFMFRFITEVIGGANDKEIMKEVESLRKEMLADRRLLKVHDLGVGSASLKRAERRISEIAAAAALPANEAALLARIAGSLDMIKHEARGAGMLKGDANQGTVERAVILELGTSLGISTLALALGAPGRRVISIEGCPELAAIARENLRNHGADNAEVLTMEFSEALSHLRSLGTIVEMAFIDGNHRGKALEEYIQRIREMGEEMIIVADDIRMNRDMTFTWKLLSTVGFTGSEDMAAVKLLPGRKSTGNRSIAVTADGISGVSAGKGQINITADGRSGNATATADSISGVSAGKGQINIAADGRSGITTATGGAEKQQLHALTDKLQQVPVSLETFRLGMLFFLRNITPGHYRVRC